MSRTTHNIITDIRDSRLNLRVPKKVQELLLKLSKERKRESLKYNTQTDIVLMAIENYFLLMGEPYE